jgi:hypothetical protein
MSGEDWNGDSFEETVRQIAREAGRSFERLMERVDVDEIADAIGADAGVVREWAESASSWLREHAETVGDELATRMSGTGRTASGPGHTPSAQTVEDALLRAAPHPLDLPTDEQGLALAALASGRWLVEPGTDALLVTGEGPAPKDTFGVVHGLRARDWLTANGEVTAVGRHALDRWLAVATHR